MSKRKTMGKAQARERRNRLLESAAAAELSLTEGIREMRAVSGMTQEEFARHRGVSARVIKAIELGQGNPTVATLNRIGEFFGLEVAYVPIKRKPISSTSLQANGSVQDRQSAIESLSKMTPDRIREIASEVFARGFSEALLQAYARREEGNLHTDSTFEGRPEDPDTTHQPPSKKRNKNAS